MVERDHYYNYHMNKGQKFDNYTKLKCIIQDLINSKKVIVNGLTTNVNHKGFKEPLLECEKEESFKPKNRDAQINYTNSNIDNVIIMLETMLEQNFNMIQSKGKNSKYDLDVDEPPRVILRYQRHEENKHLVIIIGVISPSF